MPMGRERQLGFQLHLQWQSKETEMCMLQISTTTESEKLLLRNDFPYLFNKVKRHNQMSGIMPSCGDKGFPWDCNLELADNTRKKSDIWVVFNFYHTAFMEL